MEKNQLKKNDYISLKRLKLKKRTCKIILLVFIFLIFIILHGKFMLNIGKVNNEEYNTIRILPREEALDSGLPFIKNVLKEY